MFDLLPRRYFSNDSIDKLVDRMFDRQPYGWFNITTSTSDPDAARVVVEDEGTFIYVKLPGFTRDDVELTRSGRTIKVVAEKKDHIFGTQTVNYEYTAAFDIKEVTSELKDGLLRISVEEYESEEEQDKPVKIAIK